MSGVRSINYYFKKLSREEMESNDLRTMQQSRQSREEIEENNFEAIQQSKKRTEIVNLASVNFEAISIIDLVEYEGSQFPEVPVLDAAARQLELINLIH